MVEVLAGKGRDSNNLFNVECGNEPNALAKSSHTMCRSSCLFFASVMADSSRKVCSCIPFNPCKKPFC